MSFSINFGLLTYEYGTEFLIYLFVGWVTVLFHSHKNFNQPTWELSRTEPVTIMAPRLISSPQNYLRGFIIYITSMTVLYLALSLAGPTIVLPLVSSFTNPTLSTSQPDVDTTATEPGPVTQGALVAEASEQTTGQKQESPPQWPLIVALGIVGLAPNIAGLRKPEIVLRQFSHRLAAIPAFIKYLAYEMQRSPFDYSRFADFRYSSIGVSYRPAHDSIDPTDLAWRKLCIIHRAVKQIVSGIEMIDSRMPIDERTRDSVANEVQRFGGLVLELDGKLAVQPNSRSGDTDQEVLDLQIRELLLRVYLLAACTLLAFRVRDVTTSMQKMGFGAPQKGGNWISTITHISFLLFVALLILYIAAGALLGERSTAVMASDFILRCYSVAIVVIASATAMTSAVARRNGLMEKGLWYTSGALSGVIIAYLKVATSAYISAAIVQFIFNLPFHAAAEKYMNFLILFAATHALAPMAAGVLICIWLDCGRGGSSSTMYSALYSAITLAIVSVLSSFLFAAQLGSSFKLDDWGVQIGFDAVQWLLVGLAVGLIAQIMRENETPQAPPLAAGEAV